MSFFMNPAVNTARPYPPGFRDLLSMSAAQEAAAFIATWPGYLPTPLVSLPEIASEAGVGRVLVKDEASRFGLGSFKALGGAYGVARVLESQAGHLPSPLERDAQTRPYGGTTVTCASDGNHGRSVAWGARLFGCSAVVYLPEHVTETRAQVIRDLGARVIRVDGEYDLAVAVAAREAKAEGWHVVSDTSYAGYTHIPRWVMQGYSLMLQELLEQWTGPRVTHVFVQAGVGGLAAAAVAHLWEHYDDECPRFIVVEPESADGLLESAKRGDPANSKGDLHTHMAGLSCRTVSPMVWPLLKAGVSAFMTVPDDGVHDAMRRLARLEASPPLEAGESGVAGLLGLLRAVGSPKLQSGLLLDSSSQVLLFNTEGATDRGLWNAIVAETG